MAFEKNPDISAAEDDTQRCIERSFFTTAKLDDSKLSVLAWRDSAGFIFDTNPLQAPEKKPFFAELESYNYGSIVTSVCNTVSSSWRRSPLDAARNGVDHFLVQFYVRGSGEYTTDSRGLTRFKPGDIYITDATRSLLTHTEDLQNFTLWIPRNLLEPLVTDPDALHGMLLKADDPSATILRTYLASLHEQAPGLTVAQAQAMTQPTLDLLVATLDQNPAVRNEYRHRSSVSSVASLMAVKRYINQHLDHPDLGPDKIAHACCMSRATLYRLCGPLGGVQNYIQQQRLKKVLAALMDTKLRHLSIAQIAGFWGFHEPSTFTRIFRRVFGVTPGEARGCHSLSDGAGSNIDQDVEIGDRLYEQWLTQQLL
ncbi:helix-turn-helix domain-containing protein [Pseudohongiella sp. SYSU M77423]|uniref:helix-turn-helix domain-containing protein n=1 Tax=Pseudohongiella sp. SYSU M77423 TaxID=3042312 RepID=UPI002480F7AA|nr:helix-turn-helix domain-containing protein [Pseudohongiella sp. SYSU M77423]MDH7942545.1 helix-turn-helix domain-containing protein [Pseudohongiella sp. SYSU M77423]